MYLILTCILLFNKTITLYFFTNVQIITCHRVNFNMNQDKSIQVPPPPYKYDKVWIGNKIWNMTPLFNTSKAINTLVCAALTLKTKRARTPKQRNSASDLLRYCGGVRLDTCVLVQWLKSWVEIPERPQITVRKRINEISVTESAPFPNSLYLGNV